MKKALLFSIVATLSISLMGGGRGGGGQGGMGGMGGGMGGFDRQNMGGMGGGMGGMGGGMGGMGGGMGGMGGGMYGGYAGGGMDFSGFGNMQMQQGGRNTRNNNNTSANTRDTRDTTGSSRSLTGRQTKSYGTAEVNANLRQGFTEYDFLTLNNIFSKSRGKPTFVETPTIELEDIGPTITVQPSREKNFVLVGIAQEGEELRAYIEGTSETNTTYIAPVGVDELVSNGMGVVKSISIDSIEYQKPGQNPIKIALGSDLTGAPSGVGALAGGRVSYGDIGSYTGNSTAEAMMARRRSQMLGYESPSASLGGSSASRSGAPSMAQTQENSVVRPEGMSDEDWLKFRKQQLESGKVPVPPTPAAGTTTGASATPKPDDIVRPAGMSDEAWLKYRRSVQNGEIKPEGTPAGAAAQPAAAQPAPAAEEPEVE